MNKDLMEYLNYRDTEQSTFSRLNHDIDPTDGGYMRLFNDTHDEIQDIDAHIDYLERIIGLLKDLSNKGKSLGLDKPTINL